MYHSRRNRMSCSFAKSGSTSARAIVWKARSHDAALARLEHLLVVCPRLRALEHRIDGHLRAVDDVVVEGVLDEHLGVLDTPEAPVVRRVLGEEQVRLALAVKTVGRSEAWMI